MIEVCPEEIKKLKEVYEPYIVDCEIVEDAPPEAVEAFEKVKKWAWEQGQ